MLFSSTSRGARFAFALGFLLVTAGCPRRDPGAVPPVDTGAATDARPADDGGAPDDTVDALARILMAEDQRIWNASVRSALADPRSRIRAAALLAAGRIGDPAARGEIETLLSDEDPEVRAAAAYAAGLLGQALSVPALAVMVTDPEPTVRERVARALGMLATADTAQPLEVLLGDSEPRVIVAASLAVARVPDPAFAIDPLLDRLISKERTVALAATYTLARLASSGLRGSASSQARIAETDRERIRRSLVRMASDPNADIRMYVARGLTGSRSPVEALVLGQLFEDSDPRVRVSAIQAMSFPGAEIDVFELAILDPSFHVRAATVEGLGRLRSREAARMLLDLLKSDVPTELRIRALRTLRTLDPAFAIVPSSSLAHAEDARVRVAAIQNLEFSTDPELHHLAEHLLEDVDVSVRAAAVPLLVEAPEPLVEILGENLDSDDSALLAAMAEIAGERIALEPDDDENRADVLAVLERVWEGSEGDGFSAARLATIEAAFKVGADPAVRTILVDGLDAEDRRVRASAARALSEIYDEDHSDRVGPLSERTLDDYREIVEWAQEPRAALIMVQREGYDPGRFTISLDTTSAPLASWNWAQLASTGFYNDSIVHRIVPNFVVQTGSPAARRDGGPGYAIRSERNPTRFGTGVLGMAEAAGETHGSQWFITVSPQPHLDDRFTSFGSVAQNFWGTVLLLEPEDWIVAIQVYEGTGKEQLPAW